MSGKIFVFPGKNQADYSAAMEKIKANKLVPRIWERDHTVWRENPHEISNRLGWLDCPEKAKNFADEITSFAAEINEEGFTDILLLGMGGSSLAPEVFRNILGKKDTFPDLHVIDTTDPDAVFSYAGALEGKKPLFMVSTKSGGTVETISLMKYFYKYAADNISKENPGSSFVAITDPGSGLQKMAEELKFRKIFLNDPDIGGRFSALSYFGMVPSALCGHDVDKLVSNSLSAAEQDKTGVEENPAALIGALANKGINKLTFITPDSFASFGSWVEQLIAESTGKEGKGILPVVDDKFYLMKHYGNDRLFVYLKLKSDDSRDLYVNNLINEGFPVIRFEMEDVYELSAQYFHWEFITALAGALLDIQPFDQPDVESAKVSARKVIKEFTETGKLTDPEITLEENGVKIFSEFKPSSAKAAVEEFVSEMMKRGGKSYISLQAYLQPANDTGASLEMLRHKLCEKYNVAVTTGIGPRFLHSTGQLHKGDDNSGIFIQFVNTPKNFAPIPEEPGSENSVIDFGTLKRSQALGDRDALLSKGRKVMTIDLGEDVLGNLKMFI